jgi:hypothetical protein
MLQATHTKVQEVKSDQDGWVDRSNMCFLVVVYPTPSFTINLARR